MLILEILGLLLFLASVMLFARTAFVQITTAWNRMLKKYAEWMADEFKRLFEEISVERARRIMTLTVWGPFVLGFMFGVGLPGRLLFGTLMALAGYFGPRAFVMYLRQRRLATIDDQLVDAMTLMANSLRAGLSLQQALELVVREMKPPISDEFGRMVNEIHFGTLIDDALRRFAARVPLEDLRLAVDSILTLRETGGNLSETFQVIATTIVERKKVEGKIKSMTAQGMTQGVVMCLMPIALMLLFSALDPTYMRPFFTTPIGWFMLVAVFALDAMGLWMMLKLVKVEV